MMAQELVGPWGDRPLVLATREGGRRGWLARDLPDDRVRGVVDPAVKKLELYELTAGMMKPEEKILWWETMQVVCGKLPQDASVCWLALLEYRHNGVPGMGSFPEVRLSMNLVGWPQTMGESGGGAYSLVRSDQLQDRGWAQPVVELLGNSEAEEGRPNRLCRVTLGQIKAEAWTQPLEYRTIKDLF